MKCCGYDRQTRFCSACGKELQWEPLKIMLTYRKERVRELTRKEKNEKDCQGRPTPESQLTRNKIQFHQSCVDFLEQIKRGEI